MYEIRFTPQAVEDLAILKRFHRRKIVDAIETRLSHEPTAESRHLKRLRPNAVAEWELRVGDYRVFYDVDAEAYLVKVEAVGYKRGSKLLLSGREYQL